MLRRAGIEKLPQMPTYILGRRRRREEGDVPVIAGSVFDADAEYAYRRRFRRVRRQFGGSRMRADDIAEVTPVIKFGTIRVVSSACQRKKEFQIRRVSQPEWG